MLVDSMKVSTVFQHQLSGFINFVMLTTAGYSCSYSLSSPDVKVRTDELRAEYRC